MPAATSCSEERIQFNSGSWTDEEHQGFLRGLEVYGCGSWEAIGIFVPTRSPLQIEAHAQHHFIMESESVSSEEVAGRAPSGQASFSYPCFSSSSSSCPSRNDGGGSGGGVGGGGSLLEPPVVVHLVSGVPASHPEEELYLHVGICDAAAISVPHGLMPVANNGVYAPQQKQQQQQQQQQQQALNHGNVCQAGEEPIGDIGDHGIPYPNPVIWEEPALGQLLRTCFALNDFGGVL